MAWRFWTSFVAFLHRHLREEDVDEVKEGGILWVTGERRAKAQLLEAQAAKELSESIAAFPGKVVILTPSHIAVKTDEFAGVRPLTQAEKAAYARGSLRRIGTDPVLASAFFLEGDIPAESPDLVSPTFSLLMPDPPPPELASAEANST